MIRLLLTCLACACYCMGTSQISIYVLDSLDQPLQGAQVTLDNLTHLTDQNGYCHFDDPGQILRVSFIGYTSYQTALTAVQQEEIVVRLRPSIYNLNEVELIASWMDTDDPFTYSTVEGEDLAQANLGVDVPYLLQWMPGAVVTSDAGTGIGYTGYRIRGSDPSRINVTIDGIPLNDSESQGVFWVDLPDLASSVDAIQVQRGVGASTNGAGAFGGTISLKTKAFARDPFATIDASLGSYGTRRAAISFGTGQVAKYLSVEGRASFVDSDGYIDRGSADLRSLFFSTKYLKDRSSLTLNAFTGHEITYQAWNGVPAQWIDDMDLRSSNTAGVRADGTFHPNEVDDYTQTHVHIHGKHQFQNSLVGQVSLHYTRGFGFFEQYRVGDDLSDYAIDPGMSPTTSSDLIRRRWLDNHFGGLVFSLASDHSGRWNWQLGGGANTYHGDHFGEVIWSRFAGESELGNEYYRNDAIKTDINLYGRSNLTIAASWQAFVDLQYRRVGYDFAGFNSELITADQSVSLNFFNPKFGLTWQGKNVDAYYSFAVAHREPNRDDFTNSSPNSRPKAEALFDQELGITFKNRSYRITANTFFMAYKDQLVLTGELNDVGAAIRQNVPESYRLGLELDAAYKLSSRLHLISNATFSQNRIKEFTEFIDDWDNGGQTQVPHMDTEIGYSPNTVFYGGLQWTPIARSGHHLDLAWHHKYVGSQFLDNTANPETSLDAYYFSDLEARFVIQPRWAQSLEFKLQVRNIFDSAYVSNGWVYRYKSDGYDGRADDPHTRLQSDGFYNLTGFYPQALRNFLLGMVLKF